MTPSVKSFTLEEHEQLNPRTELKSDGRSGHLRHPEHSHKWRVVRKRADHDRMKHLTPSMAWSRSVKLMSSDKLLLYDVMVSNAPTAQPSGPGTNRKRLLLLNSARLPASAALGRTTFLFVRAHAAERSTNMRRKTACGSRV